MKTIGIDIGTTTISAVVMDTERKRLLEAKTVPNGSFIRTKRDWERIQDVSLLMKKAKDILDSFPMGALSAQSGTGSESRMCLFL